MKKKGFTLVELLAVIAILAILVIIALPNVLGMFQSAKKNTFTTELQNIYKSATTQYVSDSMNRGTGSQATEIWYTRFDKGSVSCGSKAELDLSGTETIDYYIQFDLSGQVEKFMATDGEFVFWFNGNGSEDTILSGGTMTEGESSLNSKLAIEEIGSKVQVFTIAEADPITKSDSVITGGNKFYIDFGRATGTSGVCGKDATTGIPIKPEIKVCKSLNCTDEVYKTV